MAIEYLRVITMMEGSVNLSRRGFLRARLVVRDLPLRPPWAIAEPAFIAACTRCDVCVEVCPAHIVVRGDGGFPEVDFSRGECTFCRACLDACKPLALSSVLERPWFVQPEIGAACLAQGNVVCRTCGDACEARAIRFHPRLGAASIPEVEVEICSGCGACVSTCPAQAVKMKRSQEVMQ